MDKVIYTQRTSLFNCIIPRENVSSKCVHHSATNLPPIVDETKLIALHKLSETQTGEIYFGKYFHDNESKCVLIKIIKTNLINSSK
jgi:hypothetical protein